MKIRFFIIACLFLFLSLSHGQFYSTGTAPYSVKYRAIKTDKFRLIFPEDIDSLAQRFASSLDYLYPHTSKTLRHEPSKIDIVMHHQSVLSNAYVVWAPKRMELVAVPPQKTYAHNWLEQLALHEYRHVVQVDKLNQGFTKGLSAITGQMGHGAMMSFLPLWFLEGDAVVTETAFTRTGRGRDPYFIQQVKAAEMQRSQRFKYDEFYLGTYKDFAPSHYHYGYYMVAWSRMKFGTEPWEKVIRHTGRRPFVLAPFYFKLKDETGLSKVGLYNATADYLREQWMHEAPKKSENPATTITTHFGSNYSSYRFPFQQPDGSVYALRTSIDDVARLVNIKNGKEENVHTLGYFQGSKVSHSERYAAWEEIHYDLRWEQRSYSVIRIFDKQSGKSSTLKNKTMHFAPDLNAQGDRICLVSYNDINNYSIEVYNVQTKQLVQRLKMNQTEQVSFPTWLDDNRIAFVMHSNQGKSIQEVTVSTGAIRELLKPGFENISYLEGYGEWLYFTFSIEGAENIYRLNTTSFELKRISNETIGGSFAAPSANTNMLLYSEYTARGYQPRALKVENSAGTSIDSIQPHTYHLAETVTKQEPVNIQDSLIPQKNYPSRPYRKGMHLFNIHSWLVPFYMNLDELPDEQVQLYPGITLLSQSSLSNVTSSISYYYKDNQHHFKPSLSMRLFYPVLTLDYLYGGVSPIITSNATVSEKPAAIKNYSEFRTTLSIPMNFSTSRYTLNAVPALRYRYRNYYIADSVNRGEFDFSADGLFYYKGYSTIDYRLNMYAATKLAHKSLRPRWGINYFVSHLQPLQNTQYWSIYKNTTHILTAYVPGLFRHHSVRIDAGIESGFGARMALPRGYTSTDLFLYNDSKKVAFNYALPLLYPNLSVGPVAYFKRIQANLFFDSFEYTYDFNQEFFSNTIQSAGIELGIETNLLRFFWTFVPTFQYSYRLEDGTSRFGFLMTTQFGFAIGGITPYTNLQNQALPQ